VKFTDKERLDYLIESGDSVHYRRNRYSTGWVCQDALARFTSRAFVSARIAIDNAIGNRNYQRSLRR
jgi:hypothetical protein